jgi:hypothetical protein
VKLKHLIIIALILLAITFLMQKCRSCELVCMARTDLSPTSLYETNDVLAVFENGTVANLKTAKSNASMFSGVFYYVYVPDLSVAEAINKYLQPRLDTNGKRVANREYKIDTAKIIIVSGEATTDKATLATQLIKKAVAVVDEP